MRKTKALWAAILAVLVVYWPIAALSAVSWIDATGTQQTAWQLSGALGPQLIDNSGNLEAKNATASAFVIVRGATPAAANDLTTKNYVDTSIPTSLSMAGDVTGTTAASVVAGIKGNTLPALASGYLHWNGTAWVFDTPAGLSVTGSGVWHNTSGALDAAASHGTAGQILATNSGATDTTWATCSGDVTCSTATPGQYTLASTGVTAASYGSASSVPTYTVDAKGRLTAASNTTISLTNANLQAGTYSNITGTGTLTAGATGAGFTLNFGTSTMSGTVPNANQAAQTLSGDVTGNTSASVVSAISGTSPIVVTPNNLQWASSATPLLSVATPTSDLATHDFTIQSQAPFATATTNKSPGNIIENLSTPLSGGNEPIYEWKRGGNVIFATGGVPGSGGTGNTTSYLWLNGAAYNITPSITNFVMSNTSGSVILEPDTAGTVTINAAHSSTAGNIVTNSSGVQLGANSTAFGGGTGVVGLTNATVTPTATCTGGVCVYGSSGSLGLDSSGVNFSSFQAPTLTCDTPPSDAATHDFVITTQAPFASATTNKSPGNLIANLATPLSGGNEPIFKLNSHGNNVFAVGGVPGNAGLGVTTSYLWLYASAYGLTPSGTNWVLSNTTGSLNVQPDVAGTITLNPAHSSTSADLLLNASGMQYGSQTAAFGGGTNVIGITNATAVPTSACTGGVCIYSNSGALEANASAIQFNTIASSPSILQTTPTSDVATAAMTIHSQDAFASATTNKAGGNLLIRGGVPASGGTAGQVWVRDGLNTNQVIVGPSNIQTWSGNWQKRQLTASPAAENTQTQAEDFQPGVARTVSSSTAVDLVDYVTASNTTGHITATFACRAITAPTSGAVGDSWTSMRTLTYRNVSGTLSTIGSVGVIDTSNDASMSATSVTPVISGTTIKFQVSNVASATVDCEATMRILVD